MNSNVHRPSTVVAPIKFLRLISVLLIIVSGTKSYSADRISITINPDITTGIVNPLIYGNNMIGYHLMHTGKAEGFVGYSNYGAGIWDPDTKKSVAKVITLAKDIGMTIARFPGGSGSAFYNWKKTIGPPEKRPKFRYGLDEFMKTCEEIGCKVVYTLPYFTGSPEDAADLVEYLNTKNDKSNPQGGVDWASVRAKNGHPKPYNVKYFELGNEVNFGVPAKDIPGVDPVTYANDYRVYRQKMKAVDSSIMLGAVTVNSEWSKGLSPWNESLFEATGGVIDFLINHTYVGSSASGINSEDINPSIIFSNILEDIDAVEANYRMLTTQFETTTGRKNIPIAITEYNVRVNQKKPVPLRHSLGAALVNAGLFQIFIKPENNILMANYWQFVNSYWGMIKNSEYRNGTGTYVKRPNYYVIKMFHTYFKPDLIGVNIISNSAKSTTLTNDKSNILSNLSWKTDYVIGANIRINNQNVEVDFDGSRDLNFHNVYKRVAVKPNTNYTLTGYLKADSLKDMEGVCLSIEDGRGWKKTRSVETTKHVWGTTNWVKVELNYTTLSDASTVSVMLRRLSGSGVIKGEIQLKNVSLVENKNYGLHGVHVLSVSASRTKDGKKVFLMVLNKNVYKDVSTEINVSKGSFSNKIDVWTLNGPEVNSVNEIYPNTVSIKHKNINVKDVMRFNYSFPAHSLTSIELNAK